MWNDKYKLPDESYSGSNAQDYVDYIIKNHEILNYNAPVRI